MKVHTIGHSNHDWETFLGLLRAHGARTLADVRSAPRSRFPHFNRGRLETALNSAGIAYRWLGEALGGRPADPALYPGGDPAPGVLPDYERVRETPAYREGLERLAVLIEDDPEGGVCVMCAEEDPGRCHRNWLITPDLRARGIQVVHLRKAGRPEQMELV